MPDTGEENTLNPDAPLKYLEDDQLGYNEYAAYLTQVLSSQLPLDGYVVGINGRWGVGKSTMLNFVEQHLKDADNPPIVVRFSPWLFSGQADLTNKFLEEFGESLEDEDEERFEGLRSRMESLASSLSGIPISGATGMPVEQVAGVLVQLLSDEDERPVGEIKEEISDKLSESDRQIIVMIDDVDRLSPREITQIFQLIKSVADFPNTTYLLSFDRKIVVESVEEEMNIDSGEEYLEKIVQLPLVIPDHAEGSLISIFLSQLNEFEMDEELQYEQSRLDDLLQNGIAPLLDTPRDAIRLANTIAVTSGPIRQEVDFVDRSCEALCW
jgi:predicted KAP-like P-loop ATPase